MSGPHNTSPGRLRQIAEDLSAEGWHTIAGTIAQVADEKTQLLACLIEADTRLRAHPGGDTRCKEDIERAGALLAKHGHRVG